MIPDTQLMFSGGHLRPLNLDDVHPGYVEGLNDPEVNRYLDGVKRSTQTTQSVINFVKDNCSSSNSILWGIWREGSNFHCGTVRLHGIDTHHGVALIGVCLFDKAAWGNRIGSKAIAAVTEWALDYLKLRWIEAGAYDENSSSQKAFLGAGYDWICDIPGKYILEGKPAVIKIYAAHKALN
jgi:ribosomal-protein-alanine N-acetyltransferase